MNNHKIFDKKSGKTTQIEFSTEENTEKENNETEIVNKSNLDIWTIEMNRLDAMVHEGIEELLLWMRQRYNLTYSAKLTTLLSDKVSHRSTKP